MEKRKKTRNLSVAEYFKQIQREYLLAKFRRKIYSSVKDKAYWTKVVGFKEKRINEIADRNRLKSVINSPEKFNEVWNELFDENGKPKFEMTDEDINNYYSYGNEFSYKGEIWILVNYSDGKCTLQRNNTEVKLNVCSDCVCRIL